MADSISVGRGRAFSQTFSAVLSAQAQAVTNALEEQKIACQ